jgi:hypothetical protein
MGWHSRTTNILDVEAQNSGIRHLLVVRKSHISLALWLKQVRFWTVQESRRWNWTPRFI